MFIRGDVTRDVPIKVRQNGFPMNGMMLVTECVVPKKIQVLPCGQPKMEISERYGRPENLGVRFFPFRELTAYAVMTITESVQSI